ncbi:Myb-like DNA-binding domain-containing protein [Bradyrhizobium arachidis]|uniref:Myb-like DNA-binding domain-containing protein n=1 Tax=Bradyrhizobium arachidis TaxID=858423 RepID=UPI00220BA642|nr:hypothetical protein KUF59_05180 [Bradyrhizobium arachidis]
MLRNRSRRWSKEEDQRLLDLASKRESFKRISILLERSENAVVQRLRQLRLKPPGSWLPTE